MLDKANYGYIYANYILGPLSTYRGILIIPGEDKILTIPHRGGRTHVLPGRLQENEREVGANYPDTGESGESYDLELSAEVDRD